MTGYYRKFIKGYGVIAQPLTNLLKKGEFQWSMLAHEAFNSLKKAMSATPVLALPDFNLTFEVESDACSNGIGAVLSQNGKPIAFYSKALAPKHQILSVYEKEMMAILAAVKKWSAYLIGRHFKIRTDHFSLKFLLDQRTNTPAQQAWVIKMMGYDYEVVFRKGAFNVVADALSRLPHGELMALSIITSDLMKRIEHSWLQDPSLVHLIHSLSHNSGKHSKHSWQNNQLRRKNKLVIGKDLQLRQDLLKLFHSSGTGGHSGVGATIKRMGAVVHWKGMRKDVRSFIRSCSVCQQCKYDCSPYPRLLQPLPIPNRIWSKISMDFIEWLPKSNGFTMLSWWWWIGYRSMPIFYLCLTLLQP